MSHLEKNIANGVAGLGPDAKILTTVLPIEAVDISERSTGLYKGGVGSINVDTTKFDITDGYGWIANPFSDPDNPTILKVEWSGLTALTVTNLVADPRTNVAINAAGSVVQQLADFNHVDHLDKIILNRLIHPGSVITDALQIPLVTYSPNAILHDLVESIGVINIDGGNVFFENGNNLNINKTAGGTYRKGTNYGSSLAKRQSPDITTDPVSTALTFAYRYQTAPEVFTQGADTIAIDPNNYDTGTGLGAVAANKWQIQKIYYFGATNNVFIQPGQATYNTKALAEQAVGNEIFVKDPNLNEATFRCNLIVKQGTTDLRAITGEALFKIVGDFGSGVSGNGAISTSSLQQAYNNSITPEIETNDIVGPISNKRGTTGGDTDIVYEILNGSDVVTYSISGDGVITVKQVRSAKGADVASAAALPVLRDGNYFDVTGTTTITSINTLGIGTKITLHFDAALILTHHATDLILPGGANYTTAAGDEFTFIEYATGDWRCISYALASGKSLVGDNVWELPTLNMGDVSVLGTAVILNDGAGKYYSMDGASDDVFAINCNLRHNGIDYDGSSFALKLQCRLSISGVVSDTVGLLLDYGFTKGGVNSATTVTNVAQQDVDVSSEVQNVDFFITLGTMTGAVGDTMLLATVTRNSTGAGADTFTGDLEILGIEPVKI